jgi:alditol oxidase
VCPPSGRRLKNWAGNLEYGARRIHRPTSVEQVQEIVRRARIIRTLGSRHSFNDVADTAGEHVSLELLPRTIAIDPGRSTVSADGGMRYGELCGPLHAAGLALHNLASLPHISVAGACATATHGSGQRNGNLATAVSAMQVVRADGEIQTVDRSDPVALNGSVVALGALGVVTNTTLDTEPTFNVRQDVYEGLPFDQLVDHFDDIVAAAYSVSVFTEWRGPVVDQVWLKTRLDGGDGAELPGELFGAPRATEQRHPIRRMPADACTQQGGVAGPWHKRLPHFRLDHTPSAGDELQSEYFVAHESAAAALLALDPLRERIAALIQVSEVRTVAADELWLSPAYHRPSVAIHFTWKPDWVAVRELLPAIEAALAPFEPRPHWAKLFTMPADEVRSRYDQLGDFVELASRFDPDGKFRNDFLSRFVFGAR